LQQIRQVRNITLEFQQFTTGNTHSLLFVGRWNKHRNSWELNYQTRLLPFAVPLVTLVLYAAGLMPAQMWRSWLIARNPERLQELQSALGRGNHGFEEALPQADIVVWVASMPKGIEIDPAV